ncbi:MAG: hypothetical protein Q9191_000300 [Dirinaria sp. TL-2023a]
MALAELSVNNVAKNGRAPETPPGSLPDDNLNSRTPNYRAKAGLLPTPSSIQSMLKTTTEIGDVGLLASKHARPKKPRVNESITRPAYQTPLSQASSSVRSVTGTPRQYGYSYQQAGRGTPYSATHSQKGTVSGASSIYSMYRNRSETSFRSQPPVLFRGPSRGPVGIEDKSYFTIQDSSVNRSLATNMTQMSSHFQGHPDLRSLRPRSPLVYPTRLKRPTYRPSSPALGEVYQSVAGSPHASKRAPSLGTNSPLSSESITTGWQRSGNGLDPMLSRPHMYPNHHYTKKQYFLNGQHSRINNPRVYDAIPTPSPISVYPNTQYISDIENQAQPFFYDYSEGFQQQPYRHTSSLVPDGYQTHFEDSGRYFDELSTGGKDESDPQIFESPADDPLSVTIAPGTSQKNHEEVGLESPKSVSKRFSYAVSARRSAVVPNPGPEKASMDYKRTSQAASARDTLKHASNPVAYDVESVDDHTRVPFTEASHKKSNVEESMQQPDSAQHRPFVRHTVEHSTLSSYKKSQEILAEGPNYMTGSANASLYSRGSHSPSLSNGSMYSTQSASNPPSERLQCHNKPYRDTALMESSSRQQNQHSPPVILRNPSPEARRASRTEEADTEIYSPIPKRSMSSRGNRERFSSILSIDEGIPELGTVAQVSKRQARPSVANIVSQEDRTSGKIDLPHRVLEESYSPRELQETSRAQAAVVRNDQQRLPTVSSHQSYVDQAYQIGRETEARDAINLAEMPSHPFRYSSASTSRSMSMPQRSAINLLDPPTKTGSASQIQENRAPSDTASIQPAGQEDLNEPQTLDTRPPRPRSSIVSFAPPPRRDFAPLPFSFTPLRPEEREEGESVTELGKLAASYLNQPDRYDSEPSDTPPRPKETNVADRASVIASISSKGRTINSENCELESAPAFEITIPESMPHSRQAQPQSPSRFKIKVQGTSTSVRGALRKKPRPSAENERAGKESCKRRLSTSQNPVNSKSTSTKRPNLFSIPGQNNSSRPNPAQTRFVESFELQCQSHPTITLVPPSPGLNLEAQSFFSDDSSQLPPKGSLRKRISQMRAMASRASTSEDVRAPDRALLHSAMIAAVGALQESSAVPKIPVGGS